MDLLLVYHRLPYPPNKGDKMRAYQQVRFLTARHRVWLACFLDASEDYQYLGDLKRMCHKFEAVPLNKHVALSRGALSALCGRTITEGYYGSRAMWRVIQAWTQDRFFDAAFAFSSSMAAYIEDLPAGRRVLDMNDFDSSKWRDYASKRGWPVSRLFRIEARRLAARELEIIRKFDLTLMVNERECGRLGDAALCKKVAALRTPMELSHYQSIWGIDRDKIVGYVGTLSYPPNREAVLWFARSVWPEVKVRHPDAEWWIVGRRPPSEIIKLARDRSVRVTGTVDDVRPYLARMRVYVAPAQNDIGVQTKVLEALASGRAVVMSEQAHQGIMAEAGRDYVVADGPGEFSDAIDELLGDHERCCQLGQRAIDVVRARYDAEVIMPEFEHLLLGSGLAQEATS